ncbi:MAG: hypothetical protein HY513_05285 [Candidatus Aenigmarchaeota archaeon]|nr:hypothetical protein [Candidatus Aenigmarchaeota archaeon]
MKENDYEFYIKADVSKYKDEWIAIVDNKIVAHGKSAKKPTMKLKNCIQKKVH